jgi:hypothetical protein
MAEGLFSADAFVTVVYKLICLNLAEKSALAASGSLSGRK